MKKLFAGTTLFAAFLLGTFCGLPAAFCAPSETLKSQDWMPSVFGLNPAENLLGADFTGIPLLTEPVSEKAGSVIAIKTPDFAFSDEGYISGAILKCITKSKRTIDIALYGLSLPDVTDALLKAKERGVQVRVILNQSHVFTSKRSREIQLLMDNQFNIRILRGAGKWGIMHNKIAIFDGVVLISGSYNWSQAADNDNYENTVFIKDPRIVAGFGGYFNWMWNFARPVENGPFDDSVLNYGPPPHDPSPALFYGGTAFPQYNFSPWGGTERMIVAAINLSRVSVHVCMYSLFSEEISNALLAAKQRGVEVSIVVDRLQASNSPMTGFFVKNGFNFRWTAGFRKSGIMHHKFAILDNQLLISGSFNWSSAAEQNNFENVFLTMQKNYVGAFEQKFEKIFSGGFVPALSDVSRAYAQRRGFPPPWYPVEW